MISAGQVSNGGSAVKVAPTAVSLHGVLGLNRAGPWGGLGHSFSPVEGGQLPQGVCRAATVESGQLEVDARAVDVSILHGGDMAHEELAMKEVIGAGQQGVVRRAIEESTGKEYAVKLLPKSSRAMASPTALKRLRMEAALMAKLQECPNVVRLHAAFEDADHVHIVMELLKGGSLESRIAKGMVPEEEARQIMLGVLLFLEGCHEQGVAYGDVKPANFMLAEGHDRRVKAVDFGCSQQLTPGLHLRSRVGSPLFMAPEVYLGAYGLEADMWSAGVLLFQLLSGSMPFVRMEGDQIVEAGLHLGYSFTGDAWSGISQSAQELVAGLLVRDRRERLSAGQALASQWFEECSQTTSSVVEFSRHKTAAEKAAM